MATCPAEPYKLCWLNLEGFVYNALKAHWDAEAWLDFGDYIIPAYFVWGH